MKKLVIFLLLAFSWISIFAPPLSLEITHSIEAYKKDTAIQKERERVERILSTIRFVESRNNYFIKGGSTEFGAYQFTSATWKRNCDLLFGKQLDITDPENQDLIARLKIENLLKRNLTIKEIASVWNCGKRTYEGKRGVNKYGVKYDVPKYVKNFMKIYSEIDQKNLSKP